ncbi:MAG: von Willebrand factor type A domain-containing protein [Clostridia bacterium]|nr:von Willebrand factor type A domain-containing protein [Clostridia bacterium]
MKKLRTLLLLTLTLILTIIPLASCSADFELKNEALNPDEDGFDVNEDAALAPEAPADDEALAPETEKAEGDAIPESPFISTSETPISTFSADVDTASYSYFRKLVSQGTTLDNLKRLGASFRTEEFLNYFKYNATAPAEGELFGVTADVIKTPWNSDSVLMRLTLQAEDAIAYEGNNLVFLIDVSGSMNQADKLPLLKKSFGYLVEGLNANDVISIVTYSGKEEVVLTGCPGNEKERILGAINSLSAYGSTNGEAGLTKAYQLAEDYRIENGNNRIIMASDGDLNVGISSQSELIDYISQKKESKIYLSVLGFGTGNYRDSNMEALADNGNGVYYYIDGEGEAEKVLGSDLFSTLYTVAEDVKLQITFDPNAVSSYRLIGYENRRLTTEDFENDRKDAGDVGAGHQVTVFYELKLTETARTTEAWLKLAVRHKAPGEPTSKLNEYTIGAANFKQTPDDDLLFMLSLLETTMILHKTNAPASTLAAVLETLNSLDLSGHPDRAEFRALIARLA